MSREIEVLIINIGGRLVGCIRDEIKEIIPNVSRLKEHMNINKYGNVHIIELAEFLKLKGDHKYRSLLVVTNEDGKKFFFAVPEVKDTITLNIFRISVVPDYIRRKQQPLVVWGLYTDSEKNIILVTFAHISETQIKDK
jgi:hypothetical protein